MRDDQYSEPFWRWLRSPKFVRRRLAFVDVLGDVVRGGRKGSYLVIADRKTAFESIDEIVRREIG